MLTLLTRMSLWIGSPGNHRDDAVSGMALATEKHFDSDCSQEWL
jgi:hypothetical protein